MSAPAKIPLVVRKNIKDEYDAKLPELLARIKTTLGQEYAAKVDFPTIFAGTQEGYQQNSIGKIAFDVIEYFANNVDRLTENGTSKDAVDMINKVISTHTITIVLEEGLKSWSTGRVTDGVWECVFRTKEYGTNAGDTSDNLKVEIDEELFRKEPQVLPLIAKLSLKTGWLDKQKAVEEELKEELNDAEGFTFKADYEAIWASIATEYGALSKRNKDQINLESARRNFGNFIHDYFYSLINHLKWYVKGDEMITEAFTDEVSTKEIWFEVVKEGPKQYNDNRFEDGKFILRTTPQYFGTNVGDAAEKFVDKL